MVYRVENKKSVIVPGEAKPVNVVSPLEHNTSSSETPKATIAIPPVLGNAMIESEKTEKHWEEVAKDLQARADDAAPREKEMDKIDKDAAGKERDYDYTHPIVDNIYTGKLILDEDYKRPLTEDEGEIAPETKKVTIEFDSNDLYAKVEEQLSIPSARGMTQAEGGIYPDSSYGFDDKMDKEIELDRFLKSADFQALVGKEEDKLIKAKKAESGVDDESVARIREEVVKLLLDGKKNELAQKDITPERREQLYQAYKESRAFKLVVKKEVDERVAEISPKIDYNELLRIATENARKIAEKKFELRDEKVSAVALHNSGSPIDIKGYRCGWNVITIDGSVKSPKTIVFGSGEMLKRNAWLKESDVDYANGDIICEKGEPLGTKFALEYLMAHDFKWVRQSPAGKGVKYIAKNPYIFTENGNTVNIYIAYGSCTFDATEDEIEVINGVNNPANAHKHDSALRTITITVE